MSWLFHVPSEKSRCLPVTLWRLASLIEPILKARTARFNVVIEGNNLSKHTSRTLYLEPNRLRHEMLDGQIHITDFTAGRMLILVPAQKSATLFNLTDTPTQQKPANFFDELRIRLAGRR